MQKVVVNPSAGWEMAAEMRISGGSDTRVGLVKEFVLTTLDNYARSDFVEADFGGYAPKENLSWSIEVDLDLKTATLEMTPVVFRGNGTGVNNLVCGHYVEKLMGDHWIVLWVVLYLSDGDGAIEFRRIGDSGTNIVVNDVCSIVDPEIVA